MQSDQLLAVERTVAVRGLVPVRVPLPPGALHLVASAGMCERDVVIIRPKAAGVGRAVPVKAVKR